MFVGFYAVKKSSNKKTKSRTVHMESHTLIQFKRSTIKFQNVIQLLWLFLAVFLFTDDHSDGLVHVSLSVVPSALLKLQICSIQKEKEAARCVKDENGKHPRADIELIFGVQQWHLQSKGCNCSRWAAEMLVIAATYRKWRGAWICSVCMH